MFRHLAILLMQISSKLSSFFRRNPPPPLYVLGVGFDFFSSKVFAHVWLPFHIQHRNYRQLQLSDSLSDSEKYLEVFLQNNKSVSQRFILLL